MTQFTVNLPDRIAQQVLRLAALQGQPAEEYVAGIVAQEIADDSTQEEALLASLSDGDVLALTDFQLSEEEDRRLHELLDLNSEGTLNPTDQHELDELMRTYTEGTLKKSMGWAEAVRRKLREPIRP